MAPIKFEENLKDRLEERSLPPSLESWSKLSERLDAEEKKSRKPLFWWLGMVASLIVMLAVSFQFFKTNDEENVLPEIVNQQVIDKQLEDVNTLKTETVTPKTIIVNKQKEDETKSIKKIPKKSINTKVETQLSSVHTVKEINVNKAANKESLKPLNNEKLPLKESVAIVNIPKEIDKVEVVNVDNEVDALLKSAKVTIADNAIASTNNIDADALLMSVEDELEKSFRDKAFEKIKVGYKTVKTAVVDHYN